MLALHRMGRKSVRATSLHYRRFPVLSSATQPPTAPLVLRLLPHSCKFTRNKLSVRMSDILNSAHVHGVLAS